MKTVLLAALLAASPFLVAGAAPTDAVRATRAGSGTVDATCVQLSHGSFDTAVDPNGGNATQPDTLRMTGTLTCVDAAGIPSGTGTFEHTITAPGEECTGDEHRDTSTTTVHWSDGTTSILRSDATDVTKVQGTASLVSSGSVSKDSARFAGDVLHSVGTSTGTGCGTPAGEKKVDSTNIVRLTH
ncbi:hypothetical protein AB0O91_15895 [Kitasatospora sp. NPDC089797]|uniref:hypothetical protein n=1 Tax=Kitasatospora sp. NPDC089797 TaxID=3155298 RepID=UPI003440D7DB